MVNNMLQLLLIILLMSPLLLLAEGIPAVRVKDVTRIAGREGQTLIGYGLIVGLAGSGDSDEALTQQSLANVLENFRVNIDPDDLKAQNCAAVIVTLDLPDGAHKGDRVTGTVAAIGDATSLVGGELLLTPLLGTDGTPWAIAQGSVLIGGYRFGGSGGGGDLQAKNHPTTGKISNVKLLRDVGLEPILGHSVMLFLRRPDYTTAVNLASAIDEAFYQAAEVVDQATVRVRFPAEVIENGTEAAFVSQLEQLRFVPDQRAKITFSERTGTIVIGRDVRISSVAISHGSITVNIKSTLQVSQPAPFRSGGQTAVVPDEQTTVQEQRAPLNLLPEVTSVGDLVDVLNTLGVTPQDIMAIFIALQRGGALHAEIEIL